MTTLEQLIKEGSNVRITCYHTSQYTGEYLTGEAYEIWISKCIIYLEKNYAGSTLTNTFKIASKDAIGSGLSIHDKLIGVLKAIQEMGQDVEIQDNKTECVNNEPKIFISHSSLDKNYCTLLVDLIHDIGIRTEDIFYSSLEEHGVPLGDDFLDYIKGRFTNKVYVFFMLSKHFYESKICLAEMGAAWVKSVDYLPILIPPINYDDMEGVIRPTKNSMLINTSEKLDSLKLKLEATFNLVEKMDFQRWQRKRNEFINKVNSLIEKDKKKDLDIYIDEILDGYCKNSRIKLKCINNSRKIIRPMETIIHIVDEDDNEIYETIDDIRISSIILKPFEQVIIYMDLKSPCEELKKRRIKMRETFNSFDIIG